MLPSCRSPDAASEQVWPQGLPVVSPRSGSGPSTHPSPGPAAPLPLSPSPATQREQLPGTHVGERVKGVCLVGLCVYLCLSFMGDCCFVVYITG